MNIYGLLVDGYNRLLSGFPPALRWFITLLVLAGLVYVFVTLISSNALFIILLVILLPAIIPILVNFLMDIYNFVIFLLVQLHVLKPQGP